MESGCDGEKPVLEKLEYRGIKPTAMRILVLKILLKQEYAVSLNDLETQFENVDRVTLFRTLKTFEEHRLIHRVDDGTGMIKYALCSDDCDCDLEDLHIHFHCVKCKKTYCMVNNDIPNIQLPVRFKIREVNVIIKGLCEKCS
ncbi:MAG: transcriptional repressor [Candidatus Azobacteroides sp.]|nr:transcriptional repressor [Candidatus Azobacteroides sp.]